MFEIITILFSVFLLAAHASDGNDARLKRDFPLGDLGLSSGAQEAGGQTDQFLFSMLGSGSGHKSAKQSALPQKSHARKYRQESEEYEDDYYDYSAEQLSDEEFKAKMTEIKIEIEILKLMVDDEQTKLKILEEKLNPGVEQDWEAGGQTDQFIISLLGSDTGHKSAPKSPPKTPERKYRQGSDDAYADYSSGEQSSRDELKKEIAATKEELEILKYMLADKKVKLKTMEQELHPTIDKDWEVNYY